MFFFKHETAYEMRISDWSSDVCSSGLRRILAADARGAAAVRRRDRRRLAPARDAPRDLGSAYARRIVLRGRSRRVAYRHPQDDDGQRDLVRQVGEPDLPHLRPPDRACLADAGARSEEHTSALRSLMRISYAECCLQ